VSSDARAARRRAARAARRPPAAPAPLVLHHGTIEPFVEAIRAEGLQGVHGVPPFLCSSRSRAAGYGLRAACLELVEQGHVDRPELAPKVAIVTVRVSPDVGTNAQRAAHLVVDPAHDGDYAAPGGVPASSIVNIEVLDLRKQMPDPQEIEEYAALTIRARAFENTWAGLRPYRTRVAS